MNRQQKELVVKSLQTTFSESNASFIVGYRGLSVEQMQQLRSQLRKVGGNFKVAKARLFKRALVGMDQLDILDPYLKNQIGVVFVEKEAPSIAKALSDFSKDHGNALELIAGALDGSLLLGDGIVRIASLPSKDVLRAQVCGTLNAPIVSLVFGLKMHLIRLIMVLKRVSEVKK